MFNDVITLDKMETGFDFPIDASYYWYNRLIGRCITSQCDLLSVLVIGNVSSRIFIRPDCFSIESIERPETR